MDTIKRYFKSLIQKFVLNRLNISYKEVTFFLTRLFKTDLFIKMLGHETKTSNRLLEMYGNVFIDIGANMGYYSILLHDNFKEIVAIEAHPDNALSCRKNVNSTCKNVKVINITVADKIGTIQLIISHEKSGHHLSFNTAKDESQEYITVGTEPLSSILSAYKSIDLIKMDIEGAEWLALKGAEPIMNRIKAWVIELHRSKRKQELEDKMRSYGYDKIEWIDNKHILAIHV